MAVTAQRLSAPLPAAAGPEQLLETARTIRAIQLDPISVVAGMALHRMDERTQRQPDARHAVDAGTHHGRRPRWPPEAVGPGRALSSGVDAARIAARADDREAGDRTFDPGPWRRDEEAH